MLDPLDQVVNGDGKGLRKGEMAREFRRSRCRGTSRLGRLELWLVHPADEEGHARRHVQHKHHKGPVKRELERRRP